MHYFKMLREETEDDKLSKIELDIDRIISFLKNVNEPNENTIKEFIDKSFFKENIKKAISKSNIKLDEKFIPEIMISIAKDVNDRKNMFGGISPTNSYLPFKSLYKDTHLYSTLLEIYGDTKEGRKNAEKILEITNNLITYSKERKLLSAFYWTTRTIYYLGAIIIGLIVINMAVKSSTGEGIFTNFTISGMIKKIKDTIFNFNNKPFSSLIAILGTVLFSLGLYKIVQPIAKKLFQLIKNFYERIKNKLSE